MKPAREDTIPVKNIGRCPVGVCEPVHSTGERFARLETKVAILMAGVAAVIMELAILIFRRGTL